MRLCSGNTQLRPPREDDYDFLYAIRNDLDLQSKLLSLPRPSSIERVRDWVSKISDDERSLFFIIASVSVGNALGFLQVRDINFVHGHGLVGIGLGHDNRGKGHGEVALNLLECYCRNIFRLRKLILNVHSQNEGAIRLYRRLGYRSVGILERHFYFNEGYHDICIMEKHLE